MTDMNDDRGWLEKVARKRLSHETTARLQRIVESGPGHRDYDLALLILKERVDRMGATVEVKDELDQLLDDLPEVSGVAPSPYYRDKEDFGKWKANAWFSEPAEAKCTHTMTPVAGVGGLFGSSYRGGVENKGTIAVIMTPEALPMVVKPGWSSVPGLDGFNGSGGQVIYWPWRDMMVPSDNVDAIRKIVSLHKLHMNGAVLEVACYGGHGRTGTLLAVLAALAAGWESTSAVNQFRDSYCQKAIETQEQEAWVEKAVRAVRYVLASETPVEKGVGTDA